MSAKIAVEFIIICGDIPDAGTHKQRDRFPRDLAVVSSRVLRGFDFTTGNKQLAAAVLPCYAAACCGMRRRTTPAGAAPDDSGDSIRLELAGMRAESHEGYRSTTQAIKNALTNPARSLTSRPSVRRILHGSTTRQTRQCPQD